MSKYKQTGHNSKFPELIRTWKLGESVPEWLSDISNVTLDKTTGEMKLLTKNLSGGGYEIFLSGESSRSLATVKSRKDYVCQDIKSGKVFVLTESQLDLIYDVEE